MQSTGHSSMHALSSTSTQGCAMMYVTSDSSFTDGCRTQAAPVTIIASSGGIAALGSATLGLRHWVCDTGTPALRIADYQPNNTSQAATAQPAGGRATRIASCGSPSRQTCSGPNALVSAWPAAVSRGWPTGVLYQHQTPCGSWPVKALVMFAATDAYWL